MAINTGHFGFVKAVARTDVGRKRKNNEDAFGVFHEAGVFCVADGMGGGDDGEIASAAVVKGLEDGLNALTFAADGAYAVDDVATTVEASLTKASAWIFNRTRAKRLSGCGSTFVGFALDATAPGKALAIHAGDSRLYLLHGRSIRQITHDHSVAEMIGEKDERKVNPMFRSMVMNAIGIRAKADPERTPFKVAPGDRILVCSDGLSRMVPDKKILAVSRKNEEVGAAADALIAAALEAGGIDNVTVVLVEVGALPEALPALGAPSVAGADDAATDGGERETGSTGEVGSTDSSRTMATMAPAISEEMLVPEEKDEESAPGSESVPERIVANGKKRKIDTRIVLAAVSAVLVLIVAGGIMLCLRRSDGGLVETALPMDAQPANARPVDTRPTNAVPTNAVPTNALPTNAVPAETSAPSVSPAVTNVAAAPVAAVPVATPPPALAVTNASVVAATTNAVARKSEPYEEVVKACDGETLAEFCQALRRMEGAENRELVAQMKRLEGSAHFCARMRTRESAERTVVDLKYSLAAAVRSHKALAECRTPAARDLLAWWKAIGELEPTDPSALQAAALFMTHLPEVVRR